jgi:hypothetical protein
MKIEEREVELSFIPAPDDAPVSSNGYQRELRQFEDAANSQGLAIASHVRIQKSAEGQSVLLGVFTLKLVAIVGPTLGTIVGAWLHARYSRKVRLKVGDIEAEAQTVPEVEALLARARELQQRNQSKVIHEP